MTLQDSKCNLINDYSLGQVGFEPWFTREVGNL